MKGERSLFGIKKFSFLWPNYSVVGVVVNCIATKKKQNFMKINTHQADLQTACALLRQTIQDITIIIIIIISKFKFYVFLESSCSFKGVIVFVVCSFDFIKKKKVLLFY